MKSLFNEIIPDSIRSIVHGHFVDWKVKSNYRKSDHKQIKCMNCQNFLEINYHNKKYFKCNLMGMSSSSASDIRKGYVCRQFISFVRESGVK